MNTYREKSRDAFYMLGNARKNALWDLESHNADLKGILLHNAILHCFFIEKHIRKSYQGSVIAWQPQTHCILRQSLGWPLGALHRLGGCSLALFGRSPDIRVDLVWLSGGDHGAVILYVWLDKSWLVFTLHFRLLAKIGFCWFGVLDSETTLQVTPYSLSDGGRILDFKQVRNLILKFYFWSWYGYCVRYCITFVLFVRISEFWWHWFPVYN